jgi:hypothetical protein
MGSGATILAEGPYGVDAEAVIPVEITLRAPVAQGTGCAEKLRERGYEGP